MTITFPIDSLNPVSPNHSRWKCLWHPKWDSKATLLWHVWGGQKVVTLWVKSKAAGSHWKETLAWHFTHDAIIDPSQILSLTTSFGQWKHHSWSLNPRCNLSWSCFGDSYFSFCCLCSGSHFISSFIFIEAF